ncbi:phage tail protein [Leptolyngbya sp. AN02str]|uniref:phage tail protein n=1 Tax=Leptolyngbya sp. AN02str TaxID=3423363 RepID=UPI003D31DFC9
MASWVGPPPLNKPKKRLWGLLGDLEFEVGEAPKSFGLQEKTNYAEHERIEGKPRLQWTGDSLDSLDLAFAWHCDWCDPDQKLEELRQLKDTHEPQRLVIGARFIGSFVIESISSNLKRTDPTGVTIQSEAQVKLKESPIMKDFSTVGSRSAKNFALISPFRRQA